MREDWLEALGKRVETEVTDRLGDYHGVVLLVVNLRNMKRVEPVVMTNLTELGLSPNQVGAILRHAADNAGILADG